MSSDNHNLLPVTLCDRVFGLCRIKGTSVHRSMKIETIDMLPTEALDAWSVLPAYDAAFFSVVFCEGFALAGRFVAGDRCLS